MTKKSKKIPALELQGFEDIDFNKEPDIKAAQKIIQPAKVAPQEEIEPIIEKATIEPVAAVEEKEMVEPAVAKVVRVVREPVKENYTAPVARKATAPVSNSRRKASTPPPIPKGTVAPLNKKRASFNIDEDLHRALKEYSFFQEIDMVEYIFEELVKPDLKKKGYYPPKRRKR